jgi:hypothetical protein
VTFLCGRGGVYALGAVVANYRGDQQRRDLFLSLFLEVINLSWIIYVLFFGISLIHLCIENVVPVTWSFHILEIIPNCLGPWIVTKNPHAIVFSIATYTHVHQ